MRRLRITAGILVCFCSFTSGRADAPSEHRQAYLALVYHVRPAQKENFVGSNRQYSAALNQHGISDRLLKWAAYADDATYTYIWLYPIEHLNDIEALSDVESQIDARAEAEHWNAGQDLHQAVDHTEELVLRDEPSLSRMPPNFDAWASRYCEFQLLYTSGGYGGSDSQVRSLWRKYSSTFPPGAAGGNYRVLRVLIGLQRPLWIVQHCGDSPQDVELQRAREQKLTGPAGAQVQHELLQLVRKVVVWRGSFDSQMSYPLPSHKGPAPSVSQ